MNLVILIGRLSKDPELKFVPGSGTATTTITVATDRYNSKTKEKEADFTNVVLWGKQAENTANYLTKGSQVSIQGRLQTRSYDAKDGTKKYVTEVIANLGGVEFLGGKKDNSNNEMNQDHQGSNNFDGELEVDNTDSEMPFK